MDPFGLVGGEIGEAEESDTDSASSLESAEVRALEAEARLKDHHQREDRAWKARPVLEELPSVLDAFDEVDGPPAFLNPEATRPIAESAVHGREDLSLPVIAVAKAKQATGAQFDISVLAPRLTGEKREGEEVRGPQGAVIEGKAKRYKEEEGPEYSAVQIAMLGGTVAKRLPAGVVGPTPLPQPAVAKGKGPSQAQNVAEFLNAGEGTQALMPRKGQDRRDKEKDKRGKGQSTAHSWKSESEMVLRQQFDS
mmetsp:Transcript_10440/g.18209  ORF Transcript_10440/g.18209 Transcript_10440/m.18209 type:complete len:252 (+) Transcript_10440:105-860(+)|eukprot:CAMPEP_0119105120 /NCGR_PEP_ID=MMETSP1180-20130426/3171_1 /TAXON_ID=3052 ORGANISM="Chlamydomonas cf sp, Strain CCMP681" /NCGR_SAMPLE_ID=MMETSP1180 /ASSEMBLY_ACC=CAM_ASM_000741 /LENGTH=251 /DNA_ID=CAMNT_0007090097 /DNA_START=105 /DNA_END=860 /DNA_ORIENTATION=-